MSIYAYMMCALAIALLVAGLLLYGGQSGWLHSFNWSSVKDKKAYARFLGKGIMLLAASCLISGMACEAIGVAPAVILLIAGVVASFAYLTKGSSQHYR